MIKSDLDQYCYFSLFNHILYNNLNTKSFVFLLLLFLTYWVWVSVNSSKKEEGFHLLYLPLAHSCDHCQPKLLYFREKENMHPATKTPRDLGCRGLYRTCSQSDNGKFHLTVWCLHLYLWKMCYTEGLCLSAWHGVICTAQSVCSVQDCTAVLATAASHPQLHLLSCSDPQRREITSGNNKS